MMNSSDAAPVTAASQRGAQQSGPERVHEGAHQGAQAGVQERVQQAKRWYWQRISAMVLALCVLLHLVLMVYAVRGGLSAAEILGRTQGSWAFAAFYAVFVLACAVHVPVGLANIAREWWGWRANTALAASRAFALLLLLMGLRAVWAVAAPGGAP